MFMRPFSLLRGSIYAQAITDTAYGLQIDRVGGIILNLAAQAIDLHVDRSLANIGFCLDQFMSRYRFSGAQGKEQHDLLLAIRERIDSAPRRNSFLGIEKLKGPNIICSIFGVSGDVFRRRILLMRKTSSRGSKGLAR